VTFIHLHCALSWHCLYNQNSRPGNMNPKMRCKMVQGWVFVSHVQKKKTSVNFSKLHSAPINSPKHKYKCKCTRHYSNDGTQVSMSKIPTRCSKSSLFFFVLFSTCFGRYIHASSGDISNSHLPYSWSGSGTHFAQLHKRLIKLHHTRFVQLRLLMMGECSARNM
jgi:hypothetical protein